MNSTQVIATFGGDSFNVVIYDDLDIQFPDYDIQFDEAAHEFGYPETTAMELQKHWKVNPITIAITYMIQDETIYNVLALDFAEHIFVEYGEKFKNQGLLMSLIKIGRKFQSHGTPSHPDIHLQAAIDTAKEAKDHSYIDWKEHNSPEEAEYAAGSTCDALHVVGLGIKKPTKAYYTRHAAENARIARGFQVERLNSNQYSGLREAIAHNWAVFSGFKHLELCWQVRRFIDIMNARQAGEDWPPVEATP